MIKTKEFTGISSHEKSEYWGVSSCINLYNCDLSLMQDADAIVADCEDLMALHGLNAARAREVVAPEVFFPLAAMMRAPAPSGAATTTRSSTCRPISRFARTSKRNI